MCIYYIHIIYRKIILFSSFFFMEMAPKHLRTITKKKQTDKEKAT